MKNQIKTNHTIFAIVLALCFMTIATITTEAVALTYYRTTAIGFRTSLSGIDLNGISFNGNVLDDKTLVSVSLNDVMIDGNYAEEVELEISKFSGTDSRGRHVNFNKFQGAEFIADLHDGTVLLIKIDDMYKGEEKSIKDIHFYEVSYQTNEGWQPLCGQDDDGNPIPAIPLNGRWDYSEGTETGGSKIPAYSLLLAGNSFSQNVLRPVIVPGPE